MNLFRLVLQALSHFLWVGIQISVPFFKPLNLSCAFGVISQLETSHTEASFLWTLPFRIPLHFPGMGVKCFFPLVLPARKMRTSFLLVLAAHALWDCDPLSAHRHSPMCQLLLQILTPLLKGLHLLAFSEPSHSCFLYFAQNFKLSG